ncbi:hypothetical protein D7322_23640 [Sphingobacterium puteale]|uniref:Right-handed parallel beta-helix repeat-containing protein n=1 Tax=Sphingobacterium puteale TaxID=2420510 RepID=A0A420VSI6_9SPHI|nr:hypothetical protein [Sphingobacterium puteale]RKO69227.1 hypothetical protein D7322_23640 [Sphingobacterium puteale]
MANQFLIKETMAAMRGLSACEIMALQSGCCAGIELLGYYEKGDTPAPIIYHLAPTTPDPGPDDGGSVIAVGSIKLIHNFVGDVDVKYFGAIPNADNTTLINQVLIQFDTVVLSADYKVNPVGKTDAGYTGGVKPRTGNTLKFLHGCKLYIDPNDSESYSILTLNSVNDVKIIDALVYGDVENHIGSSGEWGHGITVYGCENILLVNPQAHYCWGDGLTIASSSTHHNKNVRITGGTEAHFNRRNGVSIISCERLYIDEIIANYNGTIRGTLPMYGVDIEPNANGRDHIDCVIDSIKTWGNNEGGLEIIPAYMQHINYNAQGVFKCSIGSYVSNFDGANTQGRGSLRIAYADKAVAGIVETQRVNGYIDIENVTINDAVQRSVNFTRVADTGLSIKLGNVSINNPYTKQDNLSSRELRNAVCFITQNIQTTYGFININNLVVNDYNNNLVVGVYFRAIEDIVNVYQKVNIQRYNHIGEWSDPVEAPAYGSTGDSVIISMATPFYKKISGNYVMNNYAVVDKMVFEVSGNNSITLPNLSVVTNKRITVMANVNIDHVININGRSDTQLINVRPVKGQTVQLFGRGVLELEIKDGQWNIVKSVGEYQNAICKIKGDTISRPSSLDNTMYGFQYYDTTLKKFVYWTGTAWQN